MSQPDSPSVDLPPRDRAAEDAFVAAQAEADDVDALVGLISQAMEARRPQLAARLVGLLDGRVEIEPGSPLARARAAARMLLHEAPAADPFAYDPRVADELDVAWRLARQGRIRRVTRRIRERNQPVEGLASTQRRRRPRLTGRNRRG